MSTFAALGLVLSALAASASAADTTPAPTPAAAPALPRADPPLFIEFRPSCRMSNKGGVENPALLLVLGAALKPLLEKTVPAAVGWLYDKGVQALSAHNQKQLASSTASAVSPWIAESGKEYQFGCLVIARAKRGDAFAASEQYLERQRGGRMVLGPASNWNVAVAQDYAKDLKLARVPEFYAEIALTSLRAPSTRDPDVLAALPALQPKGRALTAAERTKLMERPAKALYRQLELAHVDYFATGAEEAKDNQKHVSLELHLEAMDEKGQWQPFFARTYDLGRLTINTENVELRSQGKDIFVPPAPRITPDGYVDRVPVRAVAVLTETDDNADLARALETALKDEQAKKAVVDATAKAVVDQLQERIDDKTGAGAAKK